MLVKSEQFLDFIWERERVRLHKEAGLPKPWTDDPILQRYKFTNLRRHHDRTSRELRECLYGPNFNEDRRAILMNCALSRYFGTWEFAEAVGWQEYDNFDFEGIKNLASERLASKKRVFTGAYVITNQGISAPKQEVVVDIFLKGLHAATPELVRKAAVTQSWERVGREMQKLTGFGGSGFMVKEVLVDTTYTGFWDKTFEHPTDGTFSYPDDWMKWTPIGPGARRGAARVLGDEDAKPVKEASAFDVIMELLEMSNSLGSPTEIRGLCPHDIQFQLCEFDKYERVRLGQGKPRSGYPGV